MLRPLTARAHRVIHIAYQIAARLGDECIEPFHVLRGLQYEQEGIVATILEACGGKRNYDPLEHENCNAGEVENTRRFDLLLEEAAREAADDGSKAVDAEHLLYVLLQMRDVEVIRLLGKHEETIRKNLSSQLDQTWQRPNTHLTSGVRSRLQQLTAHFKLKSDSETIEHLLNFWQRETDVATTGVGVLVE